MKKLLFIFALIAVMVSVTGCSNESKKQLKLEVEAMDKTCPANVGTMGDMISAKYDETANEVWCNILVVNDMVLNIGDMNDYEQIAHKETQLSLSQSEHKEFLDLLIKAGAGISYIYENASTGKNHTIHLSLNDLKEMRDNPLSDYELKEQMFENMLALVRTTYPYAIDDATTLVNLYNDSDNVVYVYQVNEEILGAPVSELEYLQEELKQMTLENLDLDNPSLISFMSSVESFGKGIVYHYVGDTSDEIFDIIFTNEDLRNILKQHTEY